MKIEDRKIDPEKRENGAWVRNIPEWGDLRLKVRGIGNKTWAKMETTLINAIPRKLRVDGIDPQERDRINRILLRDASLLDWANMEGSDGAAIPFSKEAVAKYLMSPEYEPFRDAVMWAATVVAERGEVAIEEDAGN